MNIGFIDFYLDEWHANNYPAWIAEASGGKARVTDAWALIDSPRPDGRSSARWCTDLGIRLAASQEELVSRCDAIIVLSPDNSEMYEALCQVPLRSGKPVYVDKTFAPGLAAAKRIFALAKAFGSPVFSSSALRFAEEYRDVPPLLSFSSQGPGSFETYAVHQLEPLVMLMKGEPEKVLALGAEGRQTLVTAFQDGRFADISCLGEGDFLTTLRTRDSVRAEAIQSDFFRAFIAELLAFFKTGASPVPMEETLSIMALLEAGARALKRPGTWVYLHELEGMEHG